MSNDKKPAQADLESLYKVFTVPEAPDSTLGMVDQHISQNLLGFLQEHIVAHEKDLADLEKDFSDSSIPEDPMFVSDQADFLLKNVVSQSVHTSSPSFIGHMTSALPYFMLPLSKIMMALNQNLVKIETSKAFTPLERQVIGMLHRLIYEFDDAHYQQWMHDADHSLGAFCSGGTIANITALWVARNKLLGATNEFRGVERVGLYGALQEREYKGAAILVSERGHYSLAKAADILGIGRDFIIPIPSDGRSKVIVSELEKVAKKNESEGIKTLAVVGIAGTSETGTVDPLNDLADVCEELDCHYHVDAAWGGPTLFSEKYRHLLDGIKRSDSVTIDAHKQLYVPMGAGLALFKDPSSLGNIEHHAEYIIRKGSKDLGSHTIEGSRPGMAMLVQSGLKIIGRRGYQLLIDMSFEKSRTFAAMIKKDDAFELVSEPELNILTYRYIPDELKPILACGDEEQIAQANALINLLTRRIQKTQRAHGKAFVSRTQLNPVKYFRQPVVVFRVVLANPLTTVDILKDILEEQKEIAQSDSVSKIMADIQQFVSENKARKAG